MDSPSGAKMLARSERVFDRVKAIFEEYPSCRGDDRLLTFRYLKKYCPNVRLTFRQFSELRNIPAWATIERRGREVRNAHPNLQPTDRVKHKRYKREQVFKHYYSGNLSLTDFQED